MLRIAEHVAGSQRPDASKSSSLYNAGKYDIYWLGECYLIHIHCQSDPFHL